MAHRDDREALRAKNLALERQLEEARSELERSRAAKAGPGVTARVAGIAATVIERALALARLVSPGPALARWGAGRALAFGALVAALIAGTALSLMTVITVLDADGTGVGAQPLPLVIAFWSLTAWTFVGPGTVSWLAARALRAPASAGGAGLTAGLFALGVAMMPAFVPLLTDVPRVLIGGTASGTIDEVSARPQAAWARLEPAYVLHTALGAGVSSSTDSEGRTSSHATWCAPIVPSIPWSGPVTFFACGDRGELAAGPGPGVVQGRVVPAGMLETEALRELSRQGVVVDRAPRAIHATLGGAELTFALGALALALLLGLGSLAGAILALRAATIASAPAGRRAP